MSQQEEKIMARKIHATGEAASKLSFWRVPSVIFQYGLTTAHRSTENGGCGCKRCKPYLSWSWPPLVLSTHCSLFELLSSPVLWNLASSIVFRPSVTRLSLRAKPLFLPFKHQTFTFIRRASLSPRAASFLSAQPPWARSASSVPTLSRLCGTSEGRISRFIMGSFCLKCGGTSLS